MALEVRVRGAAELHKLAAQIRAEGNKNLARKLSEALTKAADPLKESIRASAAETMPRSGGYQAVFTKALQFRVAKREGTDLASVNLTTYASGKGERRDIRALEAGNLRHPIYGRSRPGAHKGERVANPWSVTSIRAGFWKRGTESALERAEEQIEKVVDDFVHRLIDE